MTLEIQVRKVGLLETVRDGHNPLESLWVCREQCRHTACIENSLGVQVTCPWHVNLNRCQVLCSGYSFIKILPILSRGCLEGPVICNIACWNLPLSSNKNQSCNMVYAGHRSVQSPVIGPGNQYLPGRNIWLWEYLAVVNKAAVLKVWWSVVIVAYVSVPKDFLPKCSLVVAFDVSGHPSTQLLVAVTTITSGRHQAPNQAGNFRKWDNFETCNVSGLC